MSRLTHLALAAHRSRILREGIKASRTGDGRVALSAMPVLLSFFVSNQWLRELRRRGSSPLLAVDFVIPDDEQVLAGHYAIEPQSLTAAEAAALIMHADDPRGYQIVVTRNHTHSAAMSPGTSLNGILRAQ